jgi:biopolymer transport protein ExbD
MRPPLAADSPMMTRINVTPIIDVALVLVIILLITAPMLSIANLDLKLPQAVSRGAEDQSHISITLSSTGQIAVNDKVLASIEQLEAELRSRLRQDENDRPLVVVRADSGLPHRFVHEVLDRARNAGAVRLGIAIRQKGGWQR